jgi:hypothetical protein
METADARAPSDPSRNAHGVLGVRESMRLLRIYETVIASRPIERGNREFLEMLIESSARLAGYMPGGSSAAAATTGATEHLQALIARQVPQNATSVARQVLSELQRIGGREMDGGRRSLYVRRPVSALRSDYATITVIVGPGLGLGDEITFLQLLRGLAQRYPGASLTIFDLYPGLWRHLLPDARHRHYCGRPHRPFAHLATSGGSAAANELIVIFDFGGYDLHDGVIPRGSRRDVVEVSLGMRCAWAARGDSPWVEMDQSSDIREAGNYSFVHRLTRRLTGHNDDRNPWLPLRSPPPAAAARRTPVILINATSSKHVPLTPDDWRSALRTIRGRLGSRRAIEVRVFPGVHEASRADAARLCASLQEEKGVHAVALTAPGGRPLTSFNAVDCLVASLDSVDVCLTIDTFTAHLVPLFGTPTIVVALKDNREFWVPSRHAFYCLIDDFRQCLPEAAARVLRARAARRDAPSYEAVRALAEATDALRAGETDLERLEQVCAALMRYLHRAPAADHLAAEGRQWLRFWSRLLSALRREPLAPEHVAPFLQRWERSEFLKRALIEA